MFKVECGYPNQTCSFCHKSSELPTIVIRDEQGECKLRLCLDCFNKVVETGTEIKNNILLNMQQVKTVDYFKYEDVEVTQEKLDGFKEIGGCISCGSQRCRCTLDEGATGCNKLKRWIKDGVL